MDPISVSASIIAILQLTGTVIKYLNEVKSVSEDRQVLITEITNMTGFLYLLKGSAEDSQHDSTTLHALSLLNASNGPLNQLKSSLEELASKLRPGRGVQKAVKSLAWPFLKGEIKEILVKIERQKSLFGLALQNDTLYVACYLRKLLTLIFGSGLSRAIKKGIIDLQEQTQDIGEGIAQLQLSQNGMANTIFEFAHKNLILTNRKGKKRNFRMDFASQFLGSAERYIPKERSSYRELAFGNG